MRFGRRKSMLCLAVLFLVGIGYGQSLGDVAREQRAKQQPKAAPKVITNEDIPESPEADSDSGKQPDSVGKPSSPRRSAQQWKAEIQAQERAITNLQNQIQRTTASIHYTNSPARTVNGARYNEHQEQKQEQVQRMQEQLDREKRKLDDLQEAARKDGYGNAVYEP